MSVNMTLAMLREFLQGEVDEKLLAYVAMHAHKILYMSLEKLCDHANITEEQATELFRAFNADSFIAFKYILRKCLYYEFTDKGIVKRSLSSLSDESVRFNMHNLLQFSATLAFDQVEQLAREIWDVPEVDLLYAGPTQPPAAAMAYQFTQMKIRSHIYSVKDSAEILDTISPKNLILVFAFARYSMRLLMQIKLLHQRGFRIACVTDSPDSPFIPLSDYHFILANDSFDFLDSNISGMAFVQTLSLALSMQRVESLFSRMHAWDVLTQENNMFW